MIWGGGGGGGSTHIVSVLVREWCYVVIWIPRASYIYKYHPPLLLRWVYVMSLPQKKLSVHNENLIHTKQLLCIYFNSCWREPERNNTTQRFRDVVLTKPMNLLVGLNFANVQWLHVRKRSMRLASFVCVFVFRQSLLDRWRLLAVTSVELS